MVNVLVVAEVIVLVGATEDELVGGTVGIPVTIVVLAEDIVGVLVGAIVDVKP